MAKYRKKPVIIDAVQFTGMDSISAIQEMGTKDKVLYPDGRYPERCIISTREGQMRADVNDWIIKGVNGEFYPCEPDIFAKTYEKVED